MAYYNNYPYGNMYGSMPPYSAPTMPVQQTMPTVQQTPTQSTASGLNWVQGETGAKSYLVAPNSTAVLMDSEDRRRIFLKSCDSTGMPLPLEIFYKLENTEQTNKQDSDYVSRAEFENLKAKISKLEKRSVKNVSDDE